MNPVSLGVFFFFLFFSSFVASYSQSRQGGIRACIPPTLQPRPASGCSALLKGEKIHPKALSARRWKGSNANDRTNKPASASPLSFSLLSEPKSKATPRGLSHSGHGFAIRNYPKIISGPSAAVFTSPVLAGRLIAAASAALQNKSWGCSKLLITTIVRRQQGLINVKVNR